MRLYPASIGFSTPDQYLDALAIDHAVPLSSGGGNLVVVARCHGNSVNNFGDGNSILENATSGRKSFQPSISGTSGNIHLLRLGSL
ncbi:MAG: hypothetical protein Q4D38_02915 [Planctomycetia bacterium]|nr:hypothetical protein [Planctomycetia bacterium]